MNEEKDKIRSRRNRKRKDKYRSDKKKNISDEIYYNHLDAEVDDELPPSRPEWDYDEEGYGSIL